MSSNYLWLCSNFFLWKKFPTKTKIQQLSLLGSSKWWFSKREKTTTTEWMNVRNFHFRFSRKSLFLFLFNFSLKIRFSSMNHYVGKKIFFFFWFDKSFSFLFVCLSGCLLFIIFFSSKIIFRTNQEFLGHHDQSEKTFQF